MDAGEISIEHDHVISVDVHVRDRIMSVEREVDGHPLTAQPVRHRRGEPSMIFHN